MRGRRVLAVAKKELLSLKSEKTIAFAIFLQLFMAMFSSVLVVGLTTLYDPSAVSQLRGADYHVALAGEGEELLSYLGREEGLRVHRMELSPAIASLKERRISAVIYAPGTGMHAEEPIRLTLYTLQNDLQATVVIAKIREALLDYERDARSAREWRLDERPVPLDMPPGGGGAFFEFVYVMLLPLLLFLPVVISAGLAIDLITEEYQQHTLETLLSTPLSFGEAIWGKVTASLVPVPLQAGAWLLLLMANGIAIASPLAILVLVTLLSIPVVLTGALIALHYRERTNAQLIFSIAVILAIFALLALPVNPVNATIRLAVGTAGVEWIGLLLLLTVISLLLSLLLHRYAHLISRTVPLRTL